MVRIVWEVDGCIKVLSKCLDMWHIMMFGGMEGRQRGREIIVPSEKKTYLVFQRWKAGTHGEWWLFFPWQETNGQAVWEFHVDMKLHGLKVSNLGERCWLASHPLATRILSPFLGRSQILGATSGHQAEYHPIGVMFFVARSTNMERIWTLRHESNLDPYQIYQSQISSLPLLDVPILGLGTGCITDKWLRFDLVQLVKMFQWHSGYGWLLASLVLFFLFGPGFVLSHFGSRCGTYMTRPLASSQEESAPWLAPPLGMIVKTQGSISHATLADVYASLRTSGRAAQTPLANAQLAVPEVALLVALALQNPEAPGPVFMSLSRKGLYVLVDLPTLVDKARGDRASFAALCKGGFTRMPKPMRERVNFSTGVIASLQAIFDVSQFWGLCRNLWRATSSRIFVRRERMCWSSSKYGAEHVVSSVEVFGEHVELMSSLTLYGCWSPKRSVSSRRSCC